MVELVEERGEAGAGEGAVVEGGVHEDIRGSAGEGVGGGVEVVETGEEGGGEGAEERGIFVDAVYDGCIVREGGRGEGVEREGEAEGECEASGVCVEREGEDVRGGEGIIQGREGDILRRFGAVEVREKGEREEKRERGRERERREEGRRIE